MRLVFNVAGVSKFTEVGSCRPSGRCDISLEGNCLVVSWMGKTLGLVPGEDSKYPEVKKIVLDIIKTGKTYVVEVVSYCYRDKYGFNNDNSGKLAAVTVAFCTDGDESFFEKDGKLYRRISSFVDCFHPHGLDALMKWAVNTFNTHSDYERWMNDAAEDGTKMHSALEEFFKNGNRTPGLPSGLDILLSERKIEPVSFEERIFDDETGLCGKYDVLAKVNGDMTVVDWKSSKAVRFHQKLQVCWYAAVLSKQMGIPISGMIAGFGAGLCVCDMSPKQVLSGYAIVSLLRKAENEVSLFLEK